MVVVLALVTLIARVEARTDEEIKEEAVKPAAPAAEEEQKGVIFVLENEDIKDSWITIDSPTQNMGKDEYGFHLQGDTEDYQLYKIDFSRLPENAVIVSATFELGENFKGSGNGTVRIYRLLRDWEEETVTFKEPWEEGPKSGKDYVAEPTSSVFCDGSKKRFPGFDVTADVKTWRSGKAKNYGWIVTMHGTDTGHFRTRTSESSSSKEYGVDCGPKLTVKYTVPAGSSAAGG